MRINPECYFRYPTQRDILGSIVTQNPLENTLALEAAQELRNGGVHVAVELNSGSGAIEVAPRTFRITADEPALDAIEILLERNGCNKQDILP